MIFPARGNGASVPGRLHVAFAMACLLGITIHLALHGKWIATTIKNNHHARREAMVVVQPGGLKIGMPSVEVSLINQGQTETQELKS